MQQDVSDRATRTLERKAATGDQLARAQLVHIKVRGGLTLENAQRNIYGMAAHDVYSWEHPDTGTVHAFYWRHCWRSACGRDVRARIRYNSRGFLSHKQFREWRPVEILSCRTCKKSLRVLTALEYSRMDAFKKMLHLPDWSIFDE